MTPKNLLINLVIISAGLALAPAHAGKDKNVEGSSGYSNTYNQSGNRANYKAGNFKERLNQRQKEQREEYARAQKEKAEMEQEGEQNSSDSQ